MISVYNYTNYRVFLKEFLNYKKKAHPGYSLRVLSDKCGFKARDFILRIINGQRNLSKQGIFKICKGVGLHGREAGYFEDMAAFNQAKTTVEKEHYYHRMNKVRKIGNAMRLREDQFSYFSQWYHAAIQSLLPVIDFKEDYGALGKFMEPPISAPDARKSVHLLIRLGLLEKDKSGKYSAVSPMLTTGDEVKSLALSRFHKSMLELAQQSINNHPVGCRDISGVTLSVSARGFEKIQKEIKEFRQRVMAIADKDCGEDRALQVGIQCFPLSKIGRRA